MSAVVLVGLVPREAPAPTDAPDHARLPAGGMTALALGVDRDALADEVTLTAWALRQDHLLSACIAVGDVMPVALGAIFSDMAALVRHVERHAGSLCAGLASVAARVECRLDITDVAKSAVRSAEPSCSGSEFLHRRARHRSRASDLDARRSELLAALDIRLGGIVEARHDLPGRAGAARRTALLLRRDRVRDLVALVAGVAGDAAALGARIALVGPLPPHSFLREEPCHG
ncbi:GvpL/GvpF family gas vesicle protein [Roseivivax isoporae]|uniref:Uncharacterized protein n=1 Tax=Roseivivax isoporae LMG 25204 TaxID=1449351 RepID=X7FB81_9RHOB|nr:GvpL/GvpF family gas vesicle protein [Roseivivax isoporae]ETX29359.1 hypothetical protein RISW2_01430 [Roseivivax isoporae LMG 25204]